MRGDGGVELLGLHAGEVLVLAQEATGGGERGEAKLSLLDHELAHAAALPVRGLGAFDRVRVHRRRADKAEGERRGSMRVGFWRLRVGEVVV